MSKVEYEAVSSADVSATGTVVSSGPGRVRALVVQPGSVAGTVTIKDGTSVGTEMTAIATKAGGESFSVSIPGGGIPFGTDVHATMSNVSGLTVIYAAETLVA